MSLLVKVPKTGHVNIARDGQIVVLTIDGRSVTMPWRAADAIAKGLTQKAREAEEIEKHAQIREDHAFCLRAGLPFGTTNHPGLRAEAERDAQWDSKLRKQLPGGVKSKKAIGVPAFVLGQPQQEAPK